MTKEQMVLATESLFDAFHVPNREGKLKSLYRFFSSESLEMIAKTCSELASQEERFPTIVKFSEVLRRLKSLDPKKKDFVECRHCHGDGRVIADKDDGTTTAYACFCSNAARFQNYTDWFGQVRPGEHLRSDQGKDITQNMDLYLKGLEFLKTSGIKIPPKVEQKILSFKRTPNVELKPIQESPVASPQSFTLEDAPF